MFDVLGYVHGCARRRRSIAPPVRWCDTPDTIPPLAAPPPRGISCCHPAVREAEHAHSPDDRATTLRPLALGLESAHSAGARAGTPCTWCHTPRTDESATSGGRSYWSRPSARWLGRQHLIGGQGGGYAPCRSTTIWLQRLATAALRRDPSSSSARYLGACMPTTRAGRRNSMNAFFADDSSPG